MCTSKRGKHVHIFKPHHTHSGEEPHYYLAESELLELGYEEPFVHFTEDEAPAFLFPAVEKVPGVETETIVLCLSEEA